MSRAFLKERGEAEAGRVGETRRRITQITQGQTLSLSLLLSLSLSLSL
jgi:hypothetical protein